MTHYLHWFYRYADIESHFRNANIMLLIILMCGVIIGMVGMWVVLIWAQRETRIKPPLSFDDFIDGNRGWMKKVR